MPVAPVARYKLPGKERIPNMADFNELLESMENLPGNLREALATGYAALVEGDLYRTSINTHPVPPELADRWVAFIRANNRKMGLPFSEEETREQIRKYPRRFSKEPPAAPMQTRMNREELVPSRRQKIGTDPNAVHKRDAYYGAVIDEIKKVYGTMGLSIDSADIFAKVKEGDSGKAHRYIPDSKAVPAFKSFEQAATNWVVLDLAASNPVFGKLLKDAKDFIERASKAREQGSEVFADFIQGRKWLGPGKDAMV